MFLPPTIFGPEPVLRIALPAVDLPSWYYYGLICVIGALWLSAYAFAIQRARIDGWCGIPAVAVAANIAWEFDYSFVIYQQTWQRPFNIAWFLLDIYIMYQVFYSSRREYPRLTPRQFIAVIAGVCGFFAIMFGAITLDINDSYGAYTGLLANTLMSPAFLVMLYRRRSSVGQSMYVAISKCSGTFVGSVMSISLYPHSHIIWVMGIFCFVLDVVYGVLLYRQIRSEDGAPWSLRRPTPSVPRDVDADPSVTGISIAAQADSTVG